jgi:hypothetical protein
MADEPPFKIEEWDAGGHIIRKFAAADNLYIARAAYREAVARYPQSRITLRQKAHLLEEHKPARTPTN